MQLFHRRDVRHIGGEGDLLGRAGVRRAQGLRRLAFCPEATRPSGMLRLSRARVGRSNGRGTDPGLSANAFPDLAHSGLASELETIQMGVFSQIDALRWVAIPSLKNRY
ncbi:hypothetical protein PUN4_660056 [Paraburkholderia unamae]|nr:hypothetical protein PUN4_660056 [Paraburkholderia unamae]